MTRLQDHYEKVVRPALVKEFGYTNAMQCPRLEKIVVNMGVGEGGDDRLLTVIASDRRLRHHLLAVLNRLADAHVDDDLLKPRALHRVGVAELLDQAGRTTFS